MLNWYLQSGKDSDVIISSRIRLARNISNYPFETKCNISKKEEITNFIEKSISGNKYDRNFAGYPISRNNCIQKLGLNGIKRRKWHQKLRINARNSE